MDKQISYGQVIKHKTKLNPDRCYLNLLSSNKEISVFKPYYACYHLENKIKSGMLCSQKIELKHYDSESKFEIKDNTYIDIATNYGILDTIKLSDNIFTANSNSSISIFSFTDVFELKNNIQLDDPSEDNCSNVLSIYDSLLLVGMNNGNYFLFDIEKLSFTLSDKIHKFGIWALEFIDKNLFLSGADDNTVILNDLRDKKSCNLYKEHSAGITHIKRYFDSEFIYLSGSYDESISLFDIRNMSTSILKKKLDVSVWDIKQIKTKSSNKYLTISSIYEGANIYKINEEEIDLIYSFKEHEKIVYGVDTFYSNNTNELFVSTCSLYDNLVCYWIYKLNYFIFIYFIFNYLIIYFL